VDDSDYELISKQIWYVRKCKYTWHALTYPNKDKDTLYMHQLILPNTDKKLVIDHINRNGLDNRRENLRLVPVAHNIHNQAVRTASGHKGVYWFERDKCWVAKITVNYKSKHLGYFPTKEAASEAYNRAAKRYFC
jgi:hypothetical protein